MAGWLHFYSQVPCTQLNWWHELVAIGYDNGRVSICSSRGVRLIDINAHSRSITDVDIAVETGLVSYNSNMAILYSSWFFIAQLFSFRV